MELENEDLTNNSTDTRSPRHPDDDNEFAFWFWSPTFLFSTPPPQMNVAFEETPAAAVQSRYGFLNHILQSAKKSVTRNVSSAGRLLQSAKKTASKTSLLS
jgi:hypothetical protein